MAGEVGLLPGIGKIISHYRVLEELGHGGMGVVFLAKDLKIGRKVALKFLSARIAERPDARERFSREGCLAAAINHPNVCAIHELDNDEQGNPFIVMEWLEGETLRNRLKTGVLRPSELIELGIQVAAGLEAAHRKGIVHRDVKPANIFLTTKGPIKLLDFGLATIANGCATDETPTNLSPPGLPLGTFSYMSPEEALGEQVDCRTDLFSLGAVLYEAASGFTPFTGRSPVMVIYAILHKQPPALKELNPDVTGGFEKIIHKLLVKDMTRRYSTAGELSSDLRALRRELLNRKAPLVPATYAKPLSLI